MHYAFRLLIACVALWCLSPDAQASVIVSSSLSLTQLQILPAAGSVQIISPFNASAFTQVFDSLGGVDQDYNSVDDGATSANSSTTLVSSNAAASAVGLTVSTSSSLLIPQATASAGTEPGSPYGLLQGFFQIVGTTGPVSVELTATLNEIQSLSTTGFGHSATAEATFSLLLPDISGSPILFFDDPLAIGASGFMADSSSPKLTAAVTLQANTEYYLLAETESEIKGTSMTPEPSSVSLSFVGLCALVLFLRRRETTAN
jgi:hypothetical protein